MSILSVKPHDEMKAERFHKRDANSLKSSISIWQAEQYTSSLCIIFLSKSLGSSKPCNHVWKDQAHLFFFFNCNFKEVCDGAEQWL